LPTGSCQNTWTRLPHCSRSTFISAIVSHFEHIRWAHIRFGTCSKRSFMPFQILRTLRVKENFHESVRKFARFEWSHVAKMAGRLLFITIIRKFLKTFMLRIWSYQKITISAYLSPLAH
jgi:hypothetical protein